MIFSFFGAGPLRADPV